MLWQVVVWAASVGTISPSGKYTAPMNASGTATITATAGGKTARATVTFVAQDVTVAGIGIGPTNGTPGSLGTLFINANSPSDLKSQLAAAEVGGYCIFATPTGGSHSQYMTGGSFDLAKWRPKIEAYRADSATWRKASQKGTLCGVSFLDEAQCSSCWGGKAVPFSTVGQAACITKGIFGPTPVFTRSNPRQIPAGTTCLDGAMAAYDHSMGSATVWAAAEIASAKAKNLLILGGVNAENGGSIVAGCQASVTRPGQCRMAGTELINSIKAIAGDTTRTCGSFMWFGNAAQYDSYTARADNRATLNTLIAWGRTRPKPVRCGG